MGAEGYDPQYLSYGQKCPLLKSWGRGFTSRNSQKNACRVFLKECKELIWIKDIDLRRVKTITSEPSKQSLKRLRTQKNTIQKKERV